MSYCTVEDVNNMLVGFEVTDTSPVFLDKLQNDIFPQVDRYIDDHLGKYYETPITGPNALVTINRIAKLLAAAEVTQRTYIGQTPSNSPQASSWRAYADKDLADIAAGTILLPDAVPTADTPKARSHLIKDQLSQPTFKEPARFSMGKVF